mmetsp:Transcript_12415/g.12469  ORF Transcript_12415/g.12469 Transcript_12415/m.12469 type:complete len:132 (-) Transcript_12415:16-411(-)
MVSYEADSGEVIDINSDFTYVMVGNHRVQNISNNEILTPNARINNGVLDLQMMSYGNKWKTVKMFTKAMKSGSHVELGNITSVKTRLVSIEPKNPLVYNVDGEIYYGSSIQIQVMPQMITYLGQAESKLNN